VARSRVKGRKKSPSGAQPIPPAPQPPFGFAPPPFFPGYNPAGKMEVMDVVSSKEAWSEYTLNDGTKIRAKAVLLDVKKAVGQFTVEGEPVYVMQITMVNNAIVPDELRKGYVSTNKDDTKS
jgi:hypothetical protein